jgi:tRNA dimethylallyltransferase
VKGAGPPAAERRPRALVLLGPTATGKTNLALRVARAIDAEIISADSRQAYRGLEIGTAAPSREARAVVPHHGVAFLQPGERYGAGRFSRLCRKWISEIESRGRTPLLVGGTGFFVRALVQPVFDEPELDDSRRALLEEWLRSRSIHELRRWSDRLDHDLGERLPVVDRQRAGRTLELALLSGRNLTWWQRYGRPEADPLHVRIWALESEPDAHRRRIEERARRMLTAGWKQEVEALVAAGHGPDSPAMTSIGYRDVWRWSAGEISREEALHAIVRDTWQYARRQRTWIRHQLPDDVRRVDADTDVRDLAGRIAADWTRAISGDTGAGASPGNDAAETR